jgi:hypothetical protein
MLNILSLIRVLRHACGLLSNNEVMRHVCGFLSSNLVLEIHKEFREVEFGNSRI